ncbi:MAG TPA: FMN-binding protein [Candidatus Paceibacterota bacterium]|jgi:uncharacterized protein with FMN-binding domain|nr:FMN-binding protein [Candidatus Paceibacterota bacterium]
MKKYIVGGAIAAVVVAYVIFVNVDDHAAVTSSQMDNATGAPTSTPAPGGAGPTPAPDASTTPASTPATAGQYKDGTYTGPVTNAFYGNIQVVATVQGGVITSVAVPVYPNAPGHTTDVTNMAIPTLKTEAVAAQSANVQIVSGATQDSEAFQQSLAAALAQAKS